MEQTHPPESSSGPANHLRFGVSEFVAPLVREGSLEMTMRGRAAMSRGAQLHALIQKRLSEAHPEFQKEVYLKQSFQHGDFEIEVSGRIDGLFEGSDAQAPLLEEIKSTFSLEALTQAIAERQDHPYVLQLKMYGHMYRLLHGKTPQLRLRLVSSYDESEVLQPVSFDPQAFGAWVDLRLWALITQVQMGEEDARRRRQIAEHLMFPFEQPRPRQPELMAAVGEVAQSGGQLMLQAPTGLGKTVAIMLPLLRRALLANRRLYYAAPRNSQLRLGLETAQLLAKKAERPIKTLVLTAKEKICMKEEPLCDPRYCEFAAGYFDKLNQHQIPQKLAGEPVLTREHFEKVASSYQVCPFELSLEMIRHADVVIGDYNYVFSPNATLGSILPEDLPDPPQWDLMIDEAHHLPDRAAQYFSPELASYVLSAVQQSIQALPAPFAARAEKLCARALEVVLAGGAEAKGTSRRDAYAAETSWEVQLDPAPFYKLEGRLGRLVVTYINAMGQLAVDDPLVGLFRYWARFCHGLRLANQAFFMTRTEIEASESQPEQVRLKVVCCDAGNHLAQHLQAFHATVAFSATLKPFDFYRQLTGFSAQARFLEFPSPFPSENRKLMIIPQVQTTFRERERNTDKIVDTITRILPLKKGNYLIFFPSFAFLEKVAPLVKLKGFRVFSQERGMALKDLNKLLGKLEQKRKNVVILAVVGGSMAEGLDFPGDALIGAVVVGPGLPTFNFERELMKRYFQQHYGRGFDFAYAIPGMTKVVQAAGRVIRSETDRGLIVLLGRRFLYDTYCGVMPEDWFVHSPRECVSQSILADVEAFWDGPGS